MACFQLSRLPPSHRPAGLPSAIGSIPPESRGSTLRNATWKIGYEGRGEAPKAQSEAREMYSSHCASVAKIAAKEVLAAPALTLGKELRASSVAVGFEKSRENIGKVSITESKQKFTEQPLDGLHDASENLKKKQALMGSRIDLAAGGDKSCKKWQSDLTESYSANADKKFACQRQQAIDGSILRKSQVPLGQPGTAAYETETKSQFIAPVEPGRALNIASTLGKDLRAHSWDHAEQHVKSTSHWLARQSEEMANRADEKFNCVRPTAFGALAKQLRQSNLYLGKDDVDFSVGGRRQQGLARTRSVPGMVGHARY